MAGRKRQNADARKPVILDACYAAICEDGLENMSVAKVAARAGIHPSLVIHYFGTKERMLMALVDRVLGVYHELLFSMPKASDPALRLVRLVRIIWSDAWQTAVEHSVVLSIMGIARRNREVAERLDHLYASFRKFLVRGFLEARDAGAIDMTDPEEAVEAFMALVEGSHYFAHHTARETSIHRSALKKAALVLLSATPETLRLLDDEDAADTARGCCS